MVQFAESLFGLLLNQCKIDQQTIFTQFITRDIDFYLPIVPVQLFALPTKISQLVGSSKLGNDL